MPSLCSHSNTIFMRTILTLFTNQNLFGNCQPLTERKKKNNALVSEGKSLPRAAVYEGVRLCYTEGLCVRQTKNGKHSLVPRELLFIQCHGVTTQTNHVCLGQRVASPEAWLNACSCNILKLTDFAWSWICLRFKVVFLRHLQLSWLTGCDDWNTIISTNQHAVD